MSKKRKVNRPQLIFRSLGIDPITKEQSKHLIYTHAKKGVGIKHKMRKYDPTLRMHVFFAKK